jgi:hypothetical protein
LQKRWRWVERRGNAAATLPVHAALVPTRSQEQVLDIDGRLCGLPELAHGGCVAGALAGALGVAGAAVRLRRPVPTGRRLSLERTAADAVELRDGEVLLARAAAVEFSLDAPPAVTLAEAAAASKRFLGRHVHPVPGCLVCGTGRRPGDGLRIFPGPVSGRRLVAAPWVPPTGVAGATPDQLASAALDCTQLWALIAHSPSDTQDRVVTSALELRLDRPVAPGEPHVVVGWPIGREGRAWIAGAAVIGPHGEPCAVGRQTAAVASWGVPLGRPGCGHRTDATNSNQENPR